jgi:hypothetical protein
MKSLLISLIYSSVSYADVGYHLKTKVDGVQFNWSKGKSVESLEATPFIKKVDISKAALEKTKAKALGEVYDIKLINSDHGRKIFRTIANKDRSREFCILYKKKVLQCYSFPPRVKGLYDSSTTIYGGFSRQQAEDLVQDINNSLK